MKPNRPLIAGGVAAALFAASIFASPYWELHRIHSAIQSQDADAVSEHVDFPSLRENLKGQVMAVIGKEMAREDASKNPFAALGQAMAIAIVNPLIDAAVSPAGVIAMMRSGKAELPKPGEVASEPSPGSDKVDYSVSYRSWDKFALSGKGPNEGSFIFKRYGFWSWKLVAIELPAKISADMH